MNASPVLASILPCQTWHRHPQAVPRRALLGASLLATSLAHPPRSVRTKRSCTTSATAVPTRSVREQVGLALTNEAQLSEDFIQELRCAVKEADEFALQADDGVRPETWKEADVLLVGPSRTGKTTLAKFLAKLGLRAANYPLVQGEDVPQDLYSMRRSRVALLTTDADALKSIRQDRMKRLGMSSTSYAGLGTIQRELKWVKNLYSKDFSGPSTQFTCPLKHAKHTECSLN